MGSTGLSLVASLMRSSHFPRVESKLLPTRCDGVHFLLIEAGLFELLRIPIPDCELLRDSEPPPPREDVRSRRRVWYANGAAIPELEKLEALEDVEFERSMKPKPEASLNNPIQVQTGRCQTAPSRSRSRLAREVTRSRPISDTSVYECINSSHPFLHQTEVLLKMRLFRTFLCLSLSVLSSQVQAEDASSSRAKHNYQVRVLASLP